MKARRPQKSAPAPGGNHFEAKGGRHRLFPYYYAPGKKLFHVVVELSDAPGSFSSVLSLLRTKLNLIGTSTYSLSDGTAVFSGFAEAVSPGMTGQGIEKLVKGSRAAMEAVVREGRDGVLIDTYHTGLTVDGESFVLLRSRSLRHMFDRVSKMLGSGGDALLYEEGAAMGRSAVEAIQDRLEKRLARSQAGVLHRVMSAEGFGEITAEEGPAEGGFALSVRDCFECSKGAPRTGCNFMRGYFVGAAEAVFQRKFEGVETRCVLKGADRCEFRLAPKE